MTQTSRQNQIDRIAHLVPLHTSESSQSLNIHAIIIKDNGGYEIIPFDEILRCEADGNYCKIYRLDGRKLITCQTLKSIESKLPVHQFMRIHQSHVVAVTHIRRLDNTMEVTLSDGAIVPYSRRNKRLILAKLGI